MHDLILRAGLVLDGTGAEGMVADVAVASGRVTAIGHDLGAARRVIDADGLVVAPGFIDIHTHSDPVPFMAKPQPFKLVQGVTTEVIGNCGSSHGGLREDAMGDLGIDRPVLDDAQRADRFAVFLDLVERAGPTTNMATLVGHTTVRQQANGPGEHLRDGALEAMVGCVEQAFAAGALGLSSGLEYAPGAYGDVGELSVLAGVARSHGRVYTTHGRNESDLVLDSVAEAVQVARRSGARVQVSHCKASGPAVHGMAGQILDLLGSARAEGLDVAGDVYPYAACSTPLNALLPTSALLDGVDGLLPLLSDPRRRAELRRAAEGPAAANGGGIWRETTPQDVIIVMHADPSVRGRRLSELLDGRQPWDALCDLLVADPHAFSVLTTMDLDDVAAFLADPEMIVASDSVWPVDHGHPRTWGCFPHLLGHYVRELGLLTLPEAVARVTSKPAGRFGFVDRGRLVRGAVADVVAFDPALVGHGGDYLRPDLGPTGVPYVVLGGRVVVDGGDYVGRRHGRVLRADPFGAVR